ncbi:hypothetical protein EPUS_07083 [Endocarpon pusillum Z07020]|uniref:Pentacotripeptide-repeat region of PRORP domain-containing protein n=1 Tax=Endocarpon pusillum (strain Z07020 / HMAS-L-300199) TaxID=1263415 RepID=U1GWA3_ENDPU|nr:uncharacterized protein EPUS_07083 [Endocarpon pusillum Z07020]ERF76376.1 hypothetical protein EPUS_07083 [Endocarpon pusillum Z07020]
MLEQATTCAEPAVNLLLRRIEKPIRSKRVLPLSFWRYGAENTPTPVWWPAYLQDIRTISLAQSRARTTPSDASELINSGINTSLYRTALAADQRQRYDSHGRTFDSSYRQRIYKRTFSISYQDQSQTSRASGKIEEAKDDYSQQSTLELYNSPVAGTNRHDNESTDEDVPYSGGPVNVPLLDEQLPPLESLCALMGSDEKEAYDKAWQLFIRAGGEAGLAGEVLEYLSTSDHRIDLDHALAAYNLIPALERVLAHYQAAVKAACCRKKHRLAMEIHNEAIKRGFHTEVTSTFLAFLTRNGLWEIAAQVWKRLPESQRDAAKPGNRGLWQELDQDTSLPEKLQQLMDTLEQNAAIFPSGRNAVLGLSVQVLYRIFSSSKIMVSITGSGILALLDRFFHLGLLQPQHYFSGIQTLNKMVGFRNRHQLATLLYRNLDYRFPNVRFPRTLLGSLIAILCGSEGDHVASRLILRRFATDWGQPDRLAYQKVLSACARNGDSVNVSEVFAEFCSDYGTPKDMAFITPLLYVFARNGNVHETKKQFDRLHSHFAVEPDVYCWNILLTAYARARDHDGALQQYQNMKRTGLKPDQYTYGILMSMFARSGDIEALHQLVEAAKQQSISGTSAMVDSLVHAYCLNDQVEDAEALIEAATQQRLKSAPTRMWNTLLRYYAFRADTDAVLRTQERMTELSIAPDGMTYAALMQALVNTGRTQDAAAILRSLHFSNSVTATVFHYSMVLYGYALENNRDMVAVIYSEMLERFPRIGLSARLSRLRSSAHRDATLTQTRLNQALRGKPMSKGLRLSRTLDFLAQIWLEINQSDLMTEDPQPGLRRQIPAEAFPSVYMEFVIGAFARSGALEKADNLIREYQAFVDESDGSKTSSAQSFQLLTAIMSTLVQQKRFAAVDSYWNKALSMAKSMGRQRTLDLSDPVLQTDMSTPAPTRPSVGDISFDVSTPISGSQITQPFLDRGEIRIVAAHRYSLAGPLTQYMHSLGAQHLVADLPPLVRRLEEMGFSLSSKNWNHYVQVLSYSNDPNLQILAFRVFEEKLLPNMPSWQLMKRSKWSKQKIVDGSGDLVIEEPVQRKLIERFRPYTLVPTYWTIVYLGLALMKSQHRGLQGQALGLDVLRSQAPGTVSAVSRMPYLREKAQGLLLRGRTLQGDPQKRPRKQPKVDRAGLRGSRSPLDHLPWDFPLDELDQMLKRDKIQSTEQPEEEQRSPPPSVEQISGEIQRSPLMLEAAGRYERELEFSRRVRASQQDQLRMLAQMREDAARPQLMMDEKRGEPSFTASLLSQHKKEKQLLQLAERKRAVPCSPDSNNASDIRPAALLSAARRPKAAARLQLLRRRRWGSPVVPKSIAAFQRGIRRKVKIAMTAYQSRLRVPNRLRRAFTKNRTARRIRSEARRSKRSDRIRQAMSEDEEETGDNMEEPDGKASEDIESESSARPES